MWRQETPGSASYHWMTLGKTLSLLHIPNILRIVLSFLVSNLIRKISFKYLQPWEFIAECCLLPDGEGEMMEVVGVWGIGDLNETFEQQETIFAPQQERMRQSSGIQVGKACRVGDDTQGRGGEETPPSTPVVLSVDQIQLQASQDKHMAFTDSNINHNGKNRE